MPQRLKLAALLPIILAFSLFSFTLVQAADYDLKISPSDIYFSEDTLIAGNKIRIYAKVHNVGSKDMVGYVSFLSGVELIGNSQAVSVLPGSSDDVFVDFIVPDRSFNILAKIQGTEPADQNSANDETQTKLITPEFDTDADGLIDSQDPDDDNDGLLDPQENEDSCPYRLRADSDNDGVKDGSDAFPCNSAESVDTDADGIGNNADVDDDNDGWSDAQEQSRGTDPFRSDTDGDGVADPQDVYPLDPAKSQEERNIFQPPAPPEDQPASDQNSQVNDSPQELPQELQNIIAAPENSADNNNEPAAEIKNELAAVVTKSSGARLVFFRLNNWLMWLIIGAIVTAAALAVLALSKTKSLFHKTLLSSAPSPEPKTAPQPVKPSPASKSSVSAKPSVTVKPSLAVRLPATTRPSSHVIDLKKLKK